MRKDLEWHQALSAGLSRSGEQPAKPPGKPGGAHTHQQDERHRDGGRQPAQRIVRLSSMIRLWQ